MSIAVTDVDGEKFVIHESEAERIAKLVGGSHHKGSPGVYARKTHEIMVMAQKELREATGDYPEDLGELYDFAVEHELFGDREEAHTMCNFLKVFYCLMQKESHPMTE